MSPGTHWVMPPTSVIASPHLGQNMRQDHRARTASANGLHTPACAVAPCVRLAALAYPIITILPYQEGAPMLPCHLADVIGGRRVFLSAQGRAGAAAETITGMRRSVFRCSGVQVTGNR